MDSHEQIQICAPFRCLYSSCNDTVGVVTRQRIGLQKNHGPTTDSGKNFLFFFTKASRPALLPTQPLFNRYRGLLPWKWPDRDVKLTTHFHLVPRLGIHGAIPLHAHNSIMASTLTIVLVVLPFYMLYF